jgi:hypothetical protein
MEDFKDAAIRQYKDAILLYKYKRLATCDHLLGLAGECALKAVLGNIEPKLYTKKEYKVHIDKFWDVFISFTNSPLGAKYNGLLVSNFNDNPFKDWSISQRYYHHTYFSSHKINKHGKATRYIIRNLLQQAIIDGVL